MPGAAQGLERVSWIGAGFGPIHAGFEIGGEVATYELDYVEIDFDEEGRPTGEPRTGKMEVNASGGSGCGE